MPRFFELILVFVIAIIFFLPLTIISLLIKFTSEGPILHWSKRIGKDNKIFFMPKFRTMKINTPDVATHKLKDPQEFITNFGLYLRRNSLDELPQVFSILVGDMKLVGPRPALFNQHDLIKLRDQKGVSRLKPGITGWAQVNGRDELSIIDKVKFDEEYLKSASFSIDIYIIWLTIIKAIKKDNISH